MSEPEEGSRKSVAREAAMVAAAATGALVGAGIPDAALAAVVVAAGSQAAVSFAGGVWDRLSERRRRNATVPLVYGARLTGQGWQQFGERLLETPQRAALTHAAMSSAADTALDAKLWALGQTLANVVLDEAQLDLEWILADALTVVEAPHLKVMDRLENGSTSSPSTDFPEFGLGAMPILHALTGKGLVWQQNDVRPGSGRLMVGHQPLSSDLVSRTTWMLTSFGGLALSRMREAADAARENSGD